MALSLTIRPEATEFIIIPKQKKVVVPYHKQDLPKETLLSILKQAGIRD
jgi:predicted RNA binding protein YcfA (HicA-like mRNA interferase family)